jgi:Arc/MetJ family transcription regulator
MRLSVDIDDKLVEEVMKITGENKMSAAVAKATELFANRKKAVAILRSLREEPLNYEWSNDQLEAWGEGDGAVVSSVARKSISYRKKKQKGK